MPKLLVTHDTVFKPEPIESKFLDKSTLFRPKKGDVLGYVSRIDIGSHSRVVLDNPLGGRKIYYIFDDHVDYDFDNLGRSVCLDVPYFSQMDNKRNPYGSCNVTSVAMCLKFFGKIDATNPDELLQFMSAKGWDRHVHDHLSRLIQSFGIENKFSVATTFDAMRDHLRANKPVIYSGRFTRSGHIIVLKGFNNNAFVVNDPYGEYYSRGYKRNIIGGAHYGKDLAYSFNLLQKVSYSGSKRGWAHLVG